MNRYAELKKIVDDLGPDFEKFYDKGNNAAGTRIRKSLQDLKVLAQEIRLAVQDSKNSKE
jgi:hypothetical protein